MQSEDNRPPTSRNHIPDSQLMEEATAWFVREEADGFSAVDRCRLEAWCAQSPFHQRAYERVRALWNAPEMRTAAAGCASDGLVREMRERSGPSRRTVGIAIAATLLLSLSLWSSDLLIWLKADYSTGTGEQRVVTLPDQSTVTLNTDTSVAVRYGADRRYIELLRGEASFAVQPNPERPFTVESQGVATTAIGTQFLVRNRSVDVQVTVLSGSVRVTDDRRRSADAIRLGAGDQVSVGQEGAGAINRVDTASAAAWMQGRLVFVRTPLAEVVRDLARYHRGYVFIWNPALQSLPVTGIYDLSNPSRIFTTLADTLPIHMVRLTDHLIVVR